MKNYKQDCPLQKRATHLAYVSAKEGSTEYLSSLEHSVGNFTLLRSIRVVQITRCFHSIVIHALFLLQALYEQSLHIKSAIPHPLIRGVIRECGGKMHLREGEYEKAHTDFFEAFKNYDESGSPR
jgi:hypothetical protein